MAAIPSAGLQQWAQWHGGQGTDVTTTLPVEWQLQTETFPPSNLPVPAQGGPSHCMGYHSSECPQQQCLTPTVAGGIAKWQKRPKTFLISELLLRNCQAMVASHCHLCPGAQAELAAGPVWGYCLIQLL